MVTLKEKLIAWSRKENEDRLRIVCSLTEMLLLIIAFHFRDNNPVIWMIMYLLVKWFDYMMEGIQEYEAEAIRKNKLINIALANKEVVFNCILVVIAVICIVLICNENLNLIICIISILIAIVLVKIISEPISKYFKKLLK